MYARLDKRQSRFWCFPKLRPSSSVVPNDKTTKKGSRLVSDATDRLFGTEIHTTTDAVLAANHVAKNENAAQLTTVSEDDETSSTKNSAASAMQCEDNKHDVAQ
jgi:hypothetical protein